MLGIIGGTGLYQIEGLEVKKEHEEETPFGKPSAPILQGIFNGAEVFFLPRHGKKHHLLPHEVNYRANIFTLKSLGVTKIIGVSATGSLQENLQPSDLAIPSQYFDHTRGKRESSFFGNGVIAHVSTANPTCDVLADDIVKAAGQLGIEIHTGKTYACVEGPRLGTRAESFFLKKAGCDLVGMTNVPEAFLAREAQMAYCTIAIVTDFDCWLDNPERHASVEQAFEVYFQNIEKVKSLIKELLNTPLSETPAPIRNSLKHAVMTPEEALSTEQKYLLQVLRA